MENIYITEYVDRFFDIHDLGWSASEIFKKAYKHKMHKYVIAENNEGLYLIHEAEDDFYTEAVLPISSLLMLIVIDENYMQKLIKK